MYHSLCHIIKLKNSLNTMMLCNCFILCLVLYNWASILPIVNMNFKISICSEVKVKSVDVKKELIMLSLPAIAGQAIDPFAQLMETAYIGRLSMS